MKAAKYGYMKCEGCASDKKETRLLVRKNEKGTLSASCDECDATDYAMPGTTKHARWTRNTTLIETDAAPKPGKKEEPKPATREPTALEIMTGKRGV